MEIPRLGLKVIVIQGDSSTILRHAVGHLPETPLPGDWGNAVLAGHRDTFFRSLRNIQPVKSMCRCPLGKSPGVYIDLVPRQAKQIAFFHTNVCRSEQISVGPPLTMLSVGSKRAIALDRTQICVAVQRYFVAKGKKAGDAITPGVNHSYRCWCFAVAGQYTDTDG